MSTAQKIFNVLVVIALVVVGVVTLWPSARQLAGATTAYAYDALPHWYGGGLAIGSSQQLTVDGSGNVVTSGTMTGSGALSAPYLLTTGAVNSTSTGASLTLTTSDMAAYSMISEGLTVGNVTMTLPASTSLSSFLSTTVGVERSIMIANASTSATNPLITLAGGTGTNLTSASSTKVIIGNRAAKVHCIRMASSDVSCIMTGN
jgi:hypothetical protein